MRIASTGKENPQLLTHSNDKQGRKMTTSFDLPLAREKIAGRGLTYTVLVVPVIARSASSVISVTLPESSASQTYTVG